MKGPRSALVLGVVFVAACSYDGSQDLPSGTDLRRFDPAGAYAAALAAAGPGAVLERIEASFVREDGTQDLAAEYIPSHLKDVTTYRFVAPSGKAAKAVPIGAGGGGAHEYVKVVFSEPRWITSRSGKSTNTRKQRGMQVTRYPTGATPEPVAPPTCAFSRLFAIARTKGAPAGAVARIEYDRDGYRFVIEGTPVDLAFDAACAIKT